MYIQRYLFRYALILLNKGILPKKKNRLNLQITLIAKIRSRQHFHLHYQGHDYKSKILTLVVDSNFTKNIP